MADGYDTTTPGKSPAFQFYAKDFDSGTRALSAEEVGSYIRFLCHQWDKGSIPSDLESLARIAGISLIRMRRVWTRVEEYFIPDPDRESGTRLINRRLERERVKQELWREKSSIGGRRSQAKRNHEPTTIQPPLQPPLQPPRQPIANSPVSGLQSSDFVREKEPTRASDVDAVRAGNFVERYGQLHEKFRNGARYVGKIHHDFQEALQLVQVYDDARLDLLARVWFQADDHFAESGTRTMAKFRSRVSWCEEQLIAYEQKQAAKR